MIPFDFEYYKPDTVEGAVDIFMVLQEQGKLPIYYGGGTEIISMARANNIFTQGVVDLKGIPECRFLGFQGMDLILGGSITLTEIAESGLYPFLGTTVSRIADHTIQGKITLGGNIAGTIIYREGVLPLLIADAKAIIAGPGGIREDYLRNIFHGRLRLNLGEFIVKLIVKARFTRLHYFHRKNIKIEKIDYPLVTVLAQKDGERIALGFSGLCNYPFRSEEVEGALNEKGLSKEERIENAIWRLPAPMVKDVHGSAEYRKFVLKNTLMDALEL